MKLVAIIVLTVVATAFAMTEDTVVPEAQTDSYVDTVFVQAYAKIAKEGEASCGQFAAVTQKTVAENAALVTMNLKNMVADCSKEGDAQIAEVAKILTAAKKSLTAAKKSLSEARNADVDFGKVKVTDVTTQEGCGTAALSAAMFEKFKIVNDKLTAATNKVATAEVGVKKLTQARLKAIQDKPNQENACRCKNKAEMAAYYTAVSAKFKQQNSADWTKAHAVACALKGTATAKCAIPALPKVQDASIGIQCTTKSSAPAPPAPAPPAPARTAHICNTPQLSSKSKTNGLKGLCHECSPFDGHCHRTDVDAPGGGKARVLLCARGYKPPADGRMDADNGAKLGHCQKA